MRCAFCKETTHNVKDCSHDDLYNFSIFMTHFTQLMCLNPQQTNKKWLTNYFLNIGLKVGDIYKLDSEFVTLMKCYMANVHKMTFEEYYVNQLSKLDDTYKNIKFLYALNNYTQVIKDFVENLLTKEEVNIILNRLVRFNTSFNELGALQEKYNTMYDTMYSFFTYSITEKPFYALEGNFGKGIKEIIMDEYADTIVFKEIPYLFQPECYEEKINEPHYYVLPKMRSLS